MAALAAAVPPSPLPPGRAAPSGGPARPPARPLRWLGGVALLYLTVPIVAFAVRLAATGQRGFHDPGIFEALGVSVECATISAALIATFGVPLAFVLARSRSRLGSVVGVVVQLPLAVPPVMGGILLVYLVGPYTFLGRLFGGHLTDSLAGIVLAQTFVAAPFLVVAARSAFASIDPGLTDVAATLGHGEVGRFLRVAVPVAAPGIWAGLALSWLRAFGEYGATVVLAYHPTSLPVDTFTEFSAGGLPGTMAPTALALGVAVVAVTVLGAMAATGPGLGGRHRAVAALRGRFRGRFRGRVRVAASVGRGLRGWRPAPDTPATRRDRIRQPGGPVTVGFDVDHRLGTFRLTVAHRPRSARLAVLGPSGSGKSALLRCLVGLYGAGPGPVWYGRRPVAGVPVERRRVGYVPQAFGLFPHLTVAEHLSLATDAQPEMAASWLQRLHIDGLEERLPHELSGGQRQRVALAQALSRSPDLLVLDEPFSALDAPVRHELRRELRSLQRQTGIATVLVTHDPEEAALLADEVVVLSEGRALQDGITRDVFRRPATPDVARLLGVHNLCRGVVAGPGQISAGGAPIAADTGQLAAGTRVLWSVRREQVIVRPAGDGTSPERAGARPEATSAWLAGVVTDVADVGAAVEVLVEVGPGLVLQSRLPDAPTLATGMRCRVEVPGHAVSVWADVADPVGARAGSAPAGSVG